MSLQVVPGNDETATQLEFHGFPVEEMMFSLKSVNNLYTDQKLDGGQHVTGTFAGRVKGFKYDVDKRRWVQEIEVLEADLG